MSFFSDLGDFFGGSSGGSNIGGLLGGIGGLIGGLFGDNNKLPNDVNDILDRQEIATDALMNPNDPHFLALAKSLEADKISSFAEGIKNYMNMLNRGKLSGVVNPERRDEGISQAFARARQSAGEEARQQAREYLATAAGLQPTGIALQGLLNNQQIQNNATGAMIGGGADLIGYLLGSGRSSPSTTVNVQGAYKPIQPTVRSTYGSINAASYSNPTRYYG